MTKIDPSDPKTWWEAWEESLVPEKSLIVGAQCPDHVRSLTGIPAHKLYADPETHLRASAAVSAYYGFDNVSNSHDIYNFEIEALGGKMIFGESLPTIDAREPLIASHKDLDKLVPPDSWVDRGRVRLSFEQSKLSGTAMFCAPFSLAIGLRGYVNLIRDMRRDPAFVQELFERLVNDIIPSYIKEGTDYAGVNMWVGADAWSSFPNIGPELYEKWVTPYALKLNQKLGQLGSFAMFVGNADYCEEDLSKFSQEILWKCFDNQIATSGGLPMLVLYMGRWQDYPLESVISYIDSKKAQGIDVTISVAGLNARVLRDGPIDNILSAVKRLCTLAQHTNVLSIIAGGLADDVPPEHVHAMVAAVRTYGALPISENLDEVKVEIPKRESFAEYVNKMSGGRGLVY